MAGILFVVYTLLMGLGMNTASLYLVPVTEQLNFSRGDFSLMFTLITISNATVQLIYGWIARKIGLRKMVIAGVILAPIGYLLFARAATLPGFYLGGVIFGASLALAALTSVSVLVNNWFDREQGMVLGVIVAGSGVGGSAAALLIGQTIVSSGFRPAYLLTAALLSTAILPVVLLIRSSPTAVNASASAPASPNPAADPPPPPMTAGEFFRDPILMPGLLVSFLLGFTVHPVWANTPAYLVDKGYSQLFAATVFSGVMLVIGGAKIGLGWIHDRLGIRACSLLGFGSLVAAAWLIPLASSEGLIWVYAFFDGISLASLSILAPLFARNLLGSQNYGAYLGFYLAVMNVGAGLGMPLMNYVFDHFRTYDGVTIVYGAVGLIALLLADRILQRAHARAG
jgi:MFS family permease